MFDWLRYFPLSIRTAGFEPVIPVGPYFTKLRKQQWVISDNIFHFSIPWANPIFGAESYSAKVDSVTPKNIDILNYKWSYSGQDGEALQRWKHGFFFKREWLFVGPWFSGKKSTLTLFASVVCPKKGTDFSGASFFQPRVFETILSDYLNSYYGHQKSGKKPTYRGPLNWKLLPLSKSIQAVCFDIHHIGNTSKENPNLQRMVAFPISDNHFIILEFNFGGTSVYQKDHIDPVNMFKLTDSIINSFSLEVGEQTQAKWDEVQKQCGDMSLTAEFGEFKWPIKPEDIGKIQPEKVAEVDVLRINNAET